MITASLHSTIPALATPFSQSGALDLKSLKNLCEHVVRGGVQSVVACGSTGEAAVLNDIEYRDVIKTVKSSIPASMPLIVGAGHSATARSIELGLIAKEYGANFLLVVTPPYNKPPPEGLRRHYAEVFRAVGLPIIAYNVPGRTGTNMGASVVKSLLDDGSIVALKESSGSIDQLTDIIGLCGDKLIVLSGEDSLVATSMLLGARGVISVTANAQPSQVVKICSAAASGDWKSAREAQFSSLKLTRAMFSETNPIPLKAALKILGVIESATLRLPLLEAKKETWELLTGLLR